MHRSQGWQKVAILQKYFNSQPCKDKNSKIMFFLLNVIIHVIFVLIKFAKL